MGPRVHAGRFTADLEGDFVVFLIGMRINKPHANMPEAGLAAAGSMRGLGSRSTSRERIGR